MTNAQPDRAILVEKLLEENRRFRLALGFYANKDNWSNDGWGVPSVIRPPDYGDCGKTARDALATPEAPS